MEASRPDWSGLYRSGAVAALIMVALIPVQSFVYLAWPPPTTGAGYFMLFQHNGLRGLLSLDLLYSVDTIGPIFGLLLLGWGASPCFFYRRARRLPCAIMRKYYAALSLYNPESEDIR